MHTGEYIVKATIQKLFQAACEAAFFILFQQRKEVPDPAAAGTV